MKSLLLLAALAAGAGAPSGAPTGAPSPRSTAAANLAYAVAQICMPYVADAKDDVLRDRAGVSPATPGPKSAFSQLKMPARRIGGVGEVDVGVGLVKGGRICLIEMNAGEPSADRKLVERILSTEPHHFAQALNANLATPGDTVFRYCAAAPSTMALTARFQAPTSAVSAPVTLIFGASIVRDRSCDEASTHPAPIAPPH